MWFLYSLAGAILISLQTIVIAKLSQFNMPLAAINACIFGFSGILCIVHFYVFKIDYDFKYTHFFWIILGAVSAYLTFVSTINALKDAPNPGYVNAIQGLCAVIVTIASLFILGSKFSLIKFVGVLFVVVGIFIIGFF